MASRQVVEVMITRGLELCKIHAISLLVRAGEASVAVSPEAKMPRRMGAHGKQLGSWTRTTGAISGREQLGVGGRTVSSFGSRPSPRIPAAKASASFLI
jgi:hypothetical protein